MITKRYEWDRTLDGKLDEGVAEPGRRRRRLGSGAGRRWRVLGSKADHIRMHIERSFGDKPFTSKELQDGAAVGRNDVKDTLRRLVAAGQLRKLGRGRWQRVPGC